MLRMNSSEQHQTALPKLAVWLLSRLANPSYREELIGDIEEEYLERQQTNQNTGKWLLRQTTLAILDGQKAMIKTTNFIKVLSVILCVLALPTLALFIGWLTNMDQTSDELWQLLLAGKVHSILLSSEYWNVALHDSAVHHFELGMFFNIPSIIWAIVFVAATYLYLKKATPSAWVFSLVALAYMLLPYLIGYTAINTFEPAAKNVGPILAFMILAPFFTLPVYVGVLFKRFSN